MLKRFLTLKTSLGGIILGIFFTALLEDSFKSVLSFMGKFLLTISTLGIQKYKDQIYLEIAKGFYEQASILILSGSIGVILAFSFITCWHLIKKEEGVNTRFSTFINKKWFKYIALLYIITSATIVILMLNQLTYQNKSIAYYKQLKAISSPFLNEDEEERYESRFALIRNRDDFIYLVNDLEKVITENMLPLPKRPAFVF